MNRLREEFGIVLEALGNFTTIGIQLGLITRSGKVVNVADLQKVELKLNSKQKKSEQKQSGRDKWDKISFN